MYAAACINNLWLIKHNLSIGVDVNAKHITGETALHVACTRHSKKAISLLIREGADISAETQEGKTPFSELIVGNQRYNECMICMIKEFSKRSFENLPIPNKDIDLIRANPVAQEHFEKCLMELEKMSSTKFYKSYSYYSVLRMQTDIKKLAKLVKNKNFVENFEQNLSYTYYGENLRTILDEAIRRKNELENAYKKLESTLGNCLPDLVLSKLAESLVFDVQKTDCEVGYFQTFIYPIFIIMTSQNSF